MRDKVTGQCPQTTTFNEKGEAKQIQTAVPLLTSQTGSPEADKQTCGFTSTETKRLIGDGEGGMSKSEWLVRAIRPSKDRGGRGTPPEQLLC